MYELYEHLSIYINRASGNGVESKVISPCALKGSLHVVLSFKVQLLRFCGYIARYTPLTVYFENVPGKVVLWLCG